MSLRLPSGRSAVQALAIACLLSFVAWFLGADLWHAILVGVAITTVGWVGFGVSVEEDEGRTRWRAPERLGRAGARTDVSALSASLGDGWLRVGPGAIWRAQQIARQRLTRLRLDLEDPADGPRIVALIGRGPYTLLRRRRFPPPTLRALVRCLDALDALPDDLSRSRPKESP